MPSLKVIITGDARKLNAELDKSLGTSEQWAKKMRATYAERNGTYASALTQGDVKKALAGVGEAAHGAHVPVRGLAHMLHMLGFEGGGAVSVLVHLFKSPLFLAIGAAAGAMWLFNKALQALSPIADSLGVKSLAPHMDDFRKKTIEARAAVLEWADGLRRGRSEADALNDSLRSLTNTTEAWAAADDKVAEAQKGLDLAKIKQLVATGQITPEEGRSRSNAVDARFDQDKLKRANDARNTVTHATFEAADKAEAGAAAARGKVPGLNDAYLDAQGKADANAERIKNAEENLKQLRKKRAELGAGGFAGMNGNSAVRINEDVLASATGAQPGLLAGAKGAKAELEKAEKDAEKLRDEAAAKRREADLRITKSAAEFKADKDVAAIKARTREQEKEPDKVGGNSLGHISLNAQQKVGAYAAVPPDFKALVAAAIQTAQNTAHLKPNSFNSVGSTPAKFGPGSHR